MRQEFPLHSIKLDRMAAIPLNRQLYSSLKELIQTHAVPAGFDLPSTRALAEDLQVSRNTVTTAYDQLSAEGYIQSRAGARASVVALPVRPATTRGDDDRVFHQISKRGELMTKQPFHYGSPGQTAFHPGMPDAAHFPFGLWGRLLARRASFAGDTLFGTYHVAGHPDLRKAIAEYLRTARGVNCTPDQIVVTTGAQAALDLLARLLLDPGDSVWMEEPGYYGAQSAFVAAGARLLPLFVENESWMLEPPDDERLRLIYVTPSCHHPLGASMRTEERLRLLEIAEKRNTWIIEDDFDGEYRFQGQPIPAMQGFDRSQRVIYIGTFAKILFPALRVGFMVLPPALQAGVVQAVSITGQFAPLLLQAALADFIEQGHMSRHLRRMRRIYAARRQSFRQLCQTHLSPWLTLMPGDTGIQIAGLLTDGIDDQAVATAARRRGINVSTLSIQYRHGRPKPGLLLGYAACSLPVMERGLRQLADAFRETVGSPHVDETPSGLPAGSIRRPDLVSRTG